MKAPEPDVVPAERQGSRARLEGWIERKTSFVIFERPSGLDQNHKNPGGFMSNIVVVKCPLHFVPEMINALNDLWFFEGHAYEYKGRKNAWFLEESVLADVEMDDMDDLVAWLQEHFTEIGINCVCVYKKEID